MPLPASFAPSRRPARTLAALAKSPGSSATRTSGRLAIARTGRRSFRANIAGHGTSATSARAVSKTSGDLRDGFEGVHLREGDILVVPSLNRLGRSVQAPITIVSGLRRCDIDCTSLLDPLDTTTPGGRLVFHVFAASPSSQARRSTRAVTWAARSRTVSSTRPPNERPARHPPTGRSTWGSAVRRHVYTPAPPYANVRGRRLLRAAGTRQPRPRASCFRAVSTVRAVATTRLSSGSGSW
ncbi:recombinase family protein [Streptomyces atratus]|uniref:recombinase family protein n=1 Tax=Streptomyces atratus TaxID=1893 RepID=UPI0033E099DB